MLEARNELPNYPLGLYRVHEFYNSLLNRWQTCPNKIVDFLELEREGLITYAVYQCRFPGCFYEERVPVNPPPNPQRQENTVKTIPMAILGSLKILA